MADALRDAFEQSPVLKAERERLRATDQSIPAAQAGFLPTISAGAEVGWQETRFAATPGLASRQKPYDWSATLEQPIFDGGAALNSVRRANANVRAARETVQSVESDVLVAAASAYADVVQARAILALQTESLKSLGITHSLVRERLAISDVTRADMAQSEAALTGAQIQVGVARANLANAEGQFLQVIRRTPGLLESFAVSRLPLAPNLETALEQANGHHPNIRAALHREAAARHNVDVAAAKHLPTVSLRASYQNRRDIDGMPAVTDPQTSATVQAVARVPLYSGGSIEAEVNAARHTQISLVHELAQERGLIRAAVTQAWSNWQQTTATRRLLGQQIDANSRALEGVKREQGAGQRAVIDVLNAERDLVASRVALEQTKRNATVAGFVLLASVGDLTLQTATAAPTTRSAEKPIALKPSTEVAAFTTTVHPSVSTGTLQKSTNAAWSTSVQATTPKQTR